MFQEYFPVLLLLTVVLGFVVTTMGATHLLGPKRHSKKKDEVFECGVESVGNARAPFSVHYFLIAILFVLFDVEVVFFYPWAVNFKHLGWIGFIEILLFTLTVCISLLYVIRNRVIDFEKEYEDNL